MTIVSQPALSARAWREIYCIPPNVDLDMGPWCPIDHCHLHCESIGWVCPTCLAWWDRRGFNGMWLAEGTAVDCQAVPDADARSLPAPVTVAASEPMPRIVAIDPVISPRLLLAGVAVLAAPCAAVYRTGQDLAGNTTGEIPATLWWAIAVLAGLGLFVLALDAVLTQRRRLREVAR